MSTQHHAPMTVQPHVLLGREGVRYLVAKHLSGVNKPEDRVKPFRLPSPDAKPVVWQVRYLNGQLSRERKVIRGQGLHYDTQDGLLYIELIEPLFDQQLKSVTQSVSIALTKFRTETGNRFPLERLDLPRDFIMSGRLDGLVLSRVGLLSKTTKMGCYSINQPAGPTRRWLGTCPASAFGFVMLKKQEQVEERIAARIKRKIDSDLSICNGCYGLKGNYGNPSMQFSMEVTRQFLETMLKLDPGYLTQILVAAIRASQFKSTKHREFLVQRGKTNRVVDVPHPAFFRIHDAGDCYSADLFKVWSDVASTMPDVTFWMPTRMWLIPHVFNKHLKNIPTNLVVRPSAFHFGDRAPRVNGYSAGSGATFLSNDMTPSDIRLAEKVVGKLVRTPQGESHGGTGFICPAYLEKQFGGGKKEGKQGGCCTRATGIGKDQQPEPKGLGCRVCWLNPSVSVVYPEH